MADHMLTTIDNPYSPVTDYDRWLTWDEQAGYFSPAYLARITITSDAMSDADQAVARETAIDEIINENPSGLYTKVVYKN